MLLCASILQSLFESLNYPSFITPKVAYEKSDTTEERSPSLKRERESASSSPEEPSALKKPKSKLLSTSELLRKSGISTDETKRAAADESNLSAAEIARRKAKERQEKERERISKRNLIKQEADSLNLASEGTYFPILSQALLVNLNVIRYIYFEVIDLYPPALVSKVKRIESRVTFAEKPTILNGEFDEEQSRKLTGRGDDWSALKKKEHLLEKELLLNARCVSILI
jgi:hypothetical protein